MTDAPLQCCDCAVIGGGPGGLTTALYLARFNRHVLLFDGGRPRACLSPWNRNYPGFPDGISGAELVARFSQQAEEFRVGRVTEWVTALEQCPEGFLVQAGGSSVQARSVVLATGVEDIWPDVPDLERLAGRYIRVCPICDAKEVTDRRAGIIGCGDKAAREALYLREFTADTTLFTSGMRESRPICDELDQRHWEAGIRMLESPITRIEPLKEDRVRVTLSDGTRAEIDLLFSALGTRARSDLAASLGAEVDVDGYLHVDANQQTTVPGLYAVGDVTTAINQVTVAVGQGAVAATAIHNSLLDF